MWVRYLTKANVFSAVGVVGFLHELFVQEAERPFVLAACLGFAGLKFALEADRAVNRGQNGQG